MRPATRMTTAVPPAGQVEEVPRSVGEAPDVTAPSPFPLGWAVRYGTANFGAGLMFAVANAALPLFLRSYGLPNAAIGLLAQDRPPTAGLTQLVVGALSDRTRSRLGRRRPYILVGVPITAAMALVLATRPPLWLMITALIVLTTALATAYGPYLALLSDLVTSEQRGRVGGIQAAANMLGQVAMLWLAGMLWVEHEPLVFVVLALGLVVAFGITYGGIKEPPLPGAGPAPLRPRPGAYLRDLLGHRDVLMYLLATLFYWFGAGGVVPFLTRFGTDELAMDEGTAFRMLMIPLLATVACTLPAGWLGDRLGKQRMLGFGLVLMGISVLAGSRVQTTEQAFAALVVTGAANAVITVMLFPLLADLIPQERSGEFMGMGSGVWELGQPVGAVVGGLAADVTGTLRTTLALAGVLTLVAAALLTLVHTAPPAPGAPRPGGAAAVKGAATEPAAATSADS